MPSSLRVASAACLLLTSCYLSHERPSSCDAGAVCGACVEGTCVLETGEGCPAGSTCTLAALDPDSGAPTTGCRPEGAGDQGDVCAAAAACRGGLTCLFGTDRSSGICAPWCCGGAGCPSGTTCAPVSVGLDDDAGVGSGPRIGALGICARPTSDCDVVRQEGCSGGAGCYPAPGYPTCMPPGALGRGEPCARITDCAPGLSCDAGDDGGTCRALCRADADCAPAERCVPIGFDGDGGRQFGICR